jgi:replication factor C subunit 3/5
MPNQKTLHHTSLKVAHLQIVQVLEFIGKKENLQLPFGFAARIAAQSNRNLRRAILFFETCKVQQ